ncbi:hypothetical protein BG006_002107, partial [Podila minutissima]
MAKSKNHTNHNQNKKAHLTVTVPRSPSRSVTPPSRVSDPKFLRNQRFAKKSSTAALKE